MCNIFLSCFYKTFWSLHCKSIVLERVQHYSSGQALRGVLLEKRINWLLPKIAQREVERERPPSKLWHCSKGTRKISLEYNDDTSEHVFI